MKTRRIALNFRMKCSFWNLKHYTGTFCKIHLYHLLQEDRCQNIYNLYKNPVQIIICTNLHLVHNIYIFAHIYNSFLYCRFCQNSGVPKTIPICRSPTIRIYVYFIKTMTEGLCLLWICNSITTNKPYTLAKKYIICLC